MKQLPSLSVLMTVFNAEKYLAASIESIRNQTFRDWEFLIVDDASTDQSLAIAEAYARIDDRIRVITNVLNKGQTASLNQGLRETRGYWIARQDADDISHPLRFEKQLEKFRMMPELVLLGTMGSMINEKNECVGLLDMPITQQLICWSAPIINPFIHTSVMFQKKIIQQLGGYHESFRIAQDYDLWARVMRYYVVENLPERLVSYRHLETSLSKTGRSTTFKEAEKVSEQMEEVAFKRSLQADERRVIASFREGILPLSEAPDFWKCYHSLEFLMKGQGRLLLKEARRLRAVYHLKLAGIFVNETRAFLVEILAAFFAAPLFTAKWLWERVSSSSGNALNLRN
ncbi:MAG: glycosyltransferase family 2 protein [Chthoniobacterales bacterium]